MESTLPTTNLEILERMAIEQALAAHNGNRTHAAAAMGISVRTLQRKIVVYHLLAAIPKLPAKTCQTSQELNGTV